MSASGSSATGAGNSCEALLERSALMHAQALKASAETAQALAELLPLLKDLVQQNQRILELLSADLVEDDDESPYFLDGTPRGN